MTRPQSRAIISPEQAAWAFLCLIAARVVMGPPFDLVVGLAGAVCFFAGAKGPGRLAWFFAGLACLALAQILVPRWFTIDRLALPDWYTVPTATLWTPWSYTAWESGRWLMLFAGAALWAPVFRGGRRFRRSLGLALRTLGMAVSGAVVWYKLAGIGLAAGENHIGVLLTMLLCEPAGRLRGGTIFVWLSAATMLGAIAMIGAWAPLAMALTVLAAGLIELPLADIRRRLTWLGWLLPVALAAGVAGLWGGVGLQSRLSVWWDAANLLAAALPWGTGFGSFRWVFPAFTEGLPKPAVRAIHPENAYLWFAIEGGLLAVAWLLVLRGGQRRIGQAAKSARVALLVLALESLIETPVLWGPIFWLLPLLINMGFVWPGRTVAEPVLPPAPTAGTGLASPA